MGIYDHLWLAKIPSAHLFSLSLPCLWGSFGFVVGLFGLN